MDSFSNLVFPLWSSEVTARIASFNFATLEMILLTTLANWQKSAYMGADLRCPES